MPLNEKEMELADYTIEKIQEMMEEVAESFKAAGVNPRFCLPCLGGTFLKTAAMIAVTTGISKEKFMRWAEKYYDTDHNAQYARRH